MIQVSVDVSCAMERAHAVTRARDGAKDSERLDRPAPADRPRPVEYVRIRVRLRDEENRAILAEPCIQIRDNGRVRQVEQRTQLREQLLSEPRHIGRHADDVKDDGAAITRPAREYLSPWIGHSGLARDPIAADAPVRAATLPRTP